MSPKKRKQIRWLTAALEDLEQIVQYLAQDAPRAAEDFTETILAKVEHLGESPYLGATCPYYRKARQLIHGRYVIYYTVHRKEVVVRAVVHGARLFRSAPRGLNSWKSCHRRHTASKELAAFAGRVFGSG